MELLIVTGLQRCLKVESRLLCYTAKRLLEQPQTLKHELGASGWMSQAFEINALLNTKCFQGRSPFPSKRYYHIVLENDEDAPPIKGNR